MDTWTRIGDRLKVLAAREEAARTGIQEGLRAARAACLDARVALGAKDAILEKHERLTWEWYKERNTCGCPRWKRLSDDPCDDCSCVWDKWLDYIEGNDELSEREKDILIEDANS